MSEPGSGSDLFAAKAKATKTDGGWRINGSKIFWTTSAQIADYMLALFRTSPSTKVNRRHGLTQFLVHMKTPSLDLDEFERGIDQALGRGLGKRISAIFRFIERHPDDLEFLARPFVQPAQMPPFEATNVTKWVAAHRATYAAASAPEHADP